MPLDRKWLNQDPTSPGFIDVANLLYGTQGRTLAETLSDMMGYALLGLDVTYYGDGYVTVAPGLIILDGQRLFLTQAQNVHIAYDQRDGGTPTSGTIYYLYAFINVQDQLDFYFSDQAPTMGVAGDTLVHDAACRFHPCFHPVDGLTARCIGQVYCTGAAAIAPFARCGCGWCVSAWTGLPGGDMTVTVNHGLGFVPPFVDIVFSTTIDGSDIVAPLANFFSSRGFGQVGARCGGISASDYTLYQFTDGAFIHADGVVAETGFFQLKFNI